MYGSILRCDQTSVLIIRDPEHNENLSGGKELFIPSHLLFGLIPDALLNSYNFWQDESSIALSDYPQVSYAYKRLRGYAKASTDEYIIIATFQFTGSWTGFRVTKGKARNGKTIQATGFPGRTVRVIRRSKAVCVKEYELRVRLASVLENCRTLCVPQVTKSDEVVESLLFKVDEMVECDYEGNGEYWPCVVLRINDNRTYDVEFEGLYKWVGVHRDVDTSLVQKRGIQKNKSEGIYLWEGMSESDEEDLRERDDTFNNKDGEDSLGRLSFDHFDNLNLLVEAVYGDEQLCVQCIEKISHCVDFKPFDSMEKLAKAVSEQLIGNPGSKCIPDNNSDMVLLNTLYAPKRSSLFSLLKVLVRIENAAHICAWTKATNLKVGHIG